MNDELELLGGGLLGAELPGAELERAWRLGGGLPGGELLGGELLRERAELLTECEGWKATSLRRKAMSVLAMKRLDDQFQILLRYRKSLLAESGEGSHPGKAQQTKPKT